jgi:hypothetical protein
VKLQEDLPSIRPSLVLPKTEALKRAIEASGKGGRAVI